jgi:hypothetical protein
VDNLTGRWPCDGLTSYDWTQEGMRLQQQGELGVSDEACAIAAALQALDQRTTAGTGRG